MPVSNSSDFYLVQHGSGTTCKLRLSISVHYSEASEITLIRLVQIVRPTL